MEPTNCPPRVELLYMLFEREKKKKPVVFSDPFGNFLSAACEMHMSVLCLSIAALSSRQS